MADTTVNTGDQESQASADTASATEHQSTEPVEQGSAEPSDDSTNERGDDEIPDWVRKQISKANKEAASYRTQVRELQDRFKDAKTDAELDAIVKPLTDKLDQSESRTRDLERELVIYKHGLDEDLAEFITGDDPKGWEEQAQKLAERFSTSKQNGNPDHRNNLSGRNGGGANSDVDPAEAARRIVARNRY